MHSSDALAWPSISMREYGSSTVEACCSMVTIMMLVLNKRTALIEHSTLPGRATLNSHQGHQEVQSPTGAPHRLNAPLSAAH